MAADFAPELVEDGTGLPSAKTYLSVAEADILLEHKPDWAKLQDETKLFALVVAAQYADARWGANLIGVSVVNPKQGLALPCRWPTNGSGRLLAPVPFGWKMAVALYALQEASGGVWASSATQEANVTMKRVTVGPITTETGYNATSTAKTYGTYPEADNLIMAMLRGFGLYGAGRTARA